MTQQFVHSGYTRSIYHDSMPLRLSTLIPERAFLISTLFWNCSLFKFMKGSIRGSLLKDLPDEVLEASRKVKSTMNSKVTEESQSN